VLPAHLCPLPGPLYTALLGYKESPVREARMRFAPVVGALFGDFLRGHAPCVAAAAGGPVDAVLPVPSSRRPSGSPLLTIDGLAAAVCTPLGGARWTPGLLTRGPRSASHMHPDALAFAVPKVRRPAVQGSRVLLLDDTYVSGARAQSAAATLRRAGGAAVLIVAAGRVLRLDRGPGHAVLPRLVGCSGVPAAGPSGDDDTERGVGAEPPPRCWRCAQIDAATE
jgi:hypothetical protein